MDFDKRGIVKEVILITTIWRGSLRNYLAFLTIVALESYAAEQKPVHILFAIPVSKYLNCFEDYTDTSGTHYTQTKHNHCWSFGLGMTTPRSWLLKFDLKSETIISESAYSNSNYVELQKSFIIEPRIGLRKYLENSLFFYEYQISGLFSNHDLKWTANGSGEENWNQLSIGFLGKLGCELCYKPFCIYGNLGGGINLYISPFNYMSQLIIKDFEIGISFRSFQWNDSKH